MNKSLIAFAAMVYAMLMIHMLPAQVKVIESAGTHVSEEGVKTLVEFQLHQSEKRESIPIYLITSETTVIVTGEVSAGGAGESHKIICHAPAKIELGGGFYRFGVSGNPLFDKKFDINAGGGSQTWEVKRGRPWVAGISGVYGVCLLVIGPIIGIGTGSTAAGLGLAAGGGGLLTIGIMNWPKAVLISQEN